jgi:PAS domain S-box-containing protein
MSPDTVPTVLSSWQDFLGRISKSYFEADKERYLVERSIEISSRELFDLNKKLEIANHLARLGYWEIDLPKKQVFWSKELYFLHGLDPAKPPPNYEEFMNMLHPEDRPRMDGLLRKEHKIDMEYETELRIANVAGEYHWFHVTFQHIVKEDSNIIRGTFVDITARKKAAQDIESLQHQIVQSARYAGMADIAASTLHNVGNVLNSANVSITLLKEYLLQSDVKKLPKIRELLEKNISHLPEYLNADPQGKVIPKYLIALFQSIPEEWDMVSLEVENLRRSITHINDIIMTQNDISRASGHTEKVFLPEVIDAALEMSTSAFEQYDIQIEKNYQELPFILVDKVKLLQILINLIQNAKDALIENLNFNQKKLIISLKKNRLKNNIILKFQDNGIGILSEDLAKIFSLGFTTKETGHGLGLHMSALNAKDIRGSLLVESNGIGNGAIFTLTFPMVEAKKSTL